MNKILSRNEIQKICEEYNIRNYTINEDATISVGGNVYLCDKNLTSIPLNFYRVTGNFLCRNNQLVSLKGSPKDVGGVFWCQNNQLTSLAHAPEFVGGDFICSNNPRLPIEILDNYKHINHIIKIQNDYTIWRRDGTLQLYRFNEMMVEIRNAKKLLI